MDTSLECMTCFMHMAVSGSRLAAPNDLQAQERVVRKWCEAVTSLDFTQSPPYVACCLNRIICEETGCKDIFKKDREESNRMVMAVLPQLEAMLDSADDPFGMALEACIVGNYIDRGVEQCFDWQGELADLRRSLDVGVVSDFSSRCVAGANVLILGDNAGEIALDTLLVKALRQRGCNVVYAVRSRPILNDALLVDAEFVGMTDLCRVVESGVDTPGTVPERCLPEFLEIMRNADVLLSKGQGNYEALHDRWDDVYYAFKAKCLRVAEQVDRPLGSSVFVK